MLVKKESCANCFGKGFNIYIPEQYNCKTVKCEVCKGTGKSEE